MDMREKNIAKIILVFVAIFVSKCFAADISASGSAVLNSAISTIDPSRVGQGLQQSAAPKVSTSYHQEDKSPKLQNEIQGADKIKFYLTRINIEGNTVFSDKELSSIYKAYLNKTVTLADIQTIVRGITLKYRAAGYVLSRAL